MDSDSAKPLDLDFLLGQLYKLKRSRAEQNARDERERRYGARVDMEKLLEHRIPHAWQGDMILFSAAGIKEARSVGAILDAPPEGWPTELPAPAPTQVGPADAQ